MRLTLLRPRDGRREEVQRLVEDLDGELAGSDGLLLSFVTQEGDRVGRMSLWQSKDDANREATRERILSLRSRIRYLSIETQEVLMEVQSGHVPRELTALLAGDLVTDESARELATTEVA